MIESLLPWVTTAAGASVMLLAGKSRTRRWAWYLGVLNQIPWVLYAVLAHAWGFIPGSMLYAGVYVRNVKRGD